MHRYPLLVGLLLCVLASASGRADVVWISTEEIMRQPIGTPAWRHLSRWAEGVTAAVRLDDNDSKHDVSTLAAAIKAVRLQDETERAKVVNALKRVTAVTEGGLSKTFTLARGMQSYVIAADIIKYRNARFKKWVEWAVQVDLPGHSGGRGILEVAKVSDNNHGGHARAALAVTAVYLEREDWLRDVTQSYRTIIGDSPDHGIDWSDTNWHDPKLRRKFGIAPAGASLGGINISGAQPEELRRGDEFKWPPRQTDYAWEGLQSILATHYVLVRSGKVDLHAGDDAILRAYNFMVNTLRWPAEGDDTWQPWLINSMFGTKFPTVTPTRPGKSVGFTDYTHAPF